MIDKCVLLATQSVNSILVCLCYSYFHFYLMFVGLSLYLLAVTVTWRTIPFKKIMCYKINSVRQNAVELVTDHTRSGTKPSAMVSRFWKIALPPNWYSQKRRTKPIRRLTFQQGSLWASTRVACGPPRGKISLSLFYHSSSETWHGSSFQHIDSHSCLCGH